MITCALLDGHLLFTSPYQMPRRSPFGKPAHAWVTQRWRTSAILSPWRTTPARLRAWAGLRFCAQLARQQATSSAFIDVARIECESAICHLLTPRCNHTFAVRAAVPEPGQRNERPAIARMP